MRILHIDIDTLRADHLRCYGYHRDTSPNLDRVASEGVRFEHCYASDAPCLPSRTALYSGRFGIHTGVVNHGGEAADMFIQGRDRGFRSSLDRTSWPALMRAAGLYTVSVSPFAERHSAWHFYAGFREMFNPGKGGLEIADEVTPLALDWIKRNGKRDNWYLHVNTWDPHTPYRTPRAFGDPFAETHGPDWITEEIIQRHRESFGPHSAREPHGYGNEKPDNSRWAVNEIASLDDFKRWIDGYDTGIRYADEHAGRLLNALADLEVLEETIVMISADHGENQGELNVYGDHHTADNITSRIPLIVRWPGLPGGRVDDSFHYQFDWAATLVELLGQRIPDSWDATPFAESFRTGKSEGRDSLVVGQCAWSCQRSVRFEDWLLMRTYHSGLKEFPPVMLYDVEKDPHLLRDRTAEQPEIVNRGLALLEQWTADEMATSSHGVDPMVTVLREGGPYHTRSWVRDYAERLRKTGRAHHAERIERGEVTFGS